MPTMSSAPAIVFNGCGQDSLAIRQRIFDIDKEERIISSPADHMLPMFQQFFKQNKTQYSSSSIRKYLHRVYSSKIRMNQLRLALPHDNYKIWDLNNDSFDRCLREALQLHFDTYGS
jgi:hypothetical protein